MDATNALNRHIWISVFGYRAPNWKDRFCPSEYEVPSLRACGLFPPRVRNFVLDAMKEERAKIEASGIERELYVFEPTLARLRDCVTDDDLPQLDPDVMQRIAEYDQQAILVLPNKGQVLNSFSDSYRDPYPR
jgi:hypothetical protein